MTAVTEKLTKTSVGWRYPYTCSTSIPRKVDSLLSERLSDLDFGQQLLDLASDKSAAGRQLLVSKISEALVGSGADHYSDGERALMGDIVGALVRQIETDIRCQLIKRHAAKDEATSDNDDRGATPRLKVGRACFDPGSHPERIIRKLLCGQAAKHCGNR